MKTPLQVISGYAELMENGLVPEEDIKKNSKLIRKEAESMRDLIDDVLTLSKLDENVQKKKEKIDLSQTVKNVVCRLEQKAQKNEVSLNVNTANDAMIEGDSSLADQMTYNLIDNAIKYNKRGGNVYVSTNAEHDHSILSVTDEGVGVPKDQRDRIFERFYRVDESRSRETGGTGLGLAIVKHAVEAFDGTIDVKDNKSSSTGTTFTIKIRQPR